MTPSTDQQEKVGADIKAARTVLVGLYGSTFIDEPRRPRLTAAENKALGDLLADHAALTFDNVNLRDEVGEWKANANKAEGVIAAQAEEIVALKNTAPCLYPSAPGETRSGFSSNGVNVEGSQDSIKAVARWNHIAAQAPEWSRAINDANERATSAEAKVTALTEEVERLKSVLKGIAKRDMGPSSRIAQAALSKARPDTGEQSQ